jgi:hypothetical protein
MDENRSSHDVKPLDARPSPPATAPGFPSPTPERLQEVIELLRAEIEQHYGIPILFVDVPAPFVGDLDGEEIWIDFEQDYELIAFNLIHLFGHTVQWNLLGKAPDIGGKEPGTYSDADIDEVVRYERDASRYGLELLHDLGVRDLDGWLADFSGSDIAYLVHFYRTGEKVDHRVFWRSGLQGLEPLPIPAFTPKRLKLRSSGVVI